METLTQRNLSFPIKNLLKLAAAITMTFGLTACSSGGGGGGNNGGGAIVIPPFGIASPVLLATFEMKSYGQIMDGWNFSTNTLTFTNMQIYGENYHNQPTTLNGYSGVVRIAGNFTMTHNSDDGRCYLPAGTYYVESSAAGNITQGSNLGATLMSTSGPAQFEMTIENGTFGGYGQRLDALVRVVRVGGVTCSSNFYGAFN